MSAGALTRPANVPSGPKTWFGGLRLESDAMMHFDMLRFVASAAIVWHHSHELFVPVAERLALEHRTQALALFVDLFFVISGYVIAFVYSARLTDLASYGRFLQRRVGRLVPLHWLTLALSFILWTAISHTGAVVAHAPDRSGLCVAQVALLLNGFTTCGNGIVLNGVTWSISAEMGMYLAFPLLLVVARRRALPALIVLGLLAGWLVMKGGRWDDIYPPLRAIPSFAFGMVLFRWRDRLPALPRSWPVLALVAVVVALMVTGVSQLLVLTAIYLLAAAAVAADRPRRAAPIVRHGAVLGQLTYGIYMWHMLFIIVMLNAIGDKRLGLHGAKMVALAIICYATILVTGYLSLRLFETPMRRRIDRL